MSPEDLKAEAQQRKVRAFLDSGTWRFRAGDIDEEARRRGMGSDAELRLSDLELPVSQGDEPEDIDLSEFQLGVISPDLSSSTLDLPPDGSRADSSAEQDILLDDLSLPPNATAASSSVIIGMQSTSSRMPSDSDVRLIPDNTAGSRPSDSDVRLTSPEFRTTADSDLKPKPKGIGKLPGDSDVTLRHPSDSDVTLRHPSDSDVTLIAGDTSDDSITIGGPGDTAVRQSLGSGSSEDMVPAFESDSDFDLSPSSSENHLQPDSGSDFELSALDGSDEFEATPLAGPNDSDVTAADPGFSGINLSRPSDSGINLQMASGLGLGKGDSIELAPLSGSTIKPTGPPSKPKPAQQVKTPPAAKKPEKDIFDDTDFEVDALDSDRDSDDRTVQLEAQSDFELEDADTGSEVFAIDEEDVDHNAATALGPAGSLSADDEDEDTFGGASEDEMGGGGWDVESESSSSSTSTGRASAPSPVLAAAGASAEWGGLWVGLLGVATLFMLFLTFVSLDLVRNLYDFRGDSPASGIVKSLAGLIAG